MTFRNLTKPCNDCICVAIAILSIYLLVPLIEIYSENYDI